VSRSLRRRLPHQSGLPINERSAGDQSAGTCLPIKWGQRVLSIILRSIAPLCGAFRLRYDLTTQCASTLWSRRGNSMRTINRIVIHHSENEDNFRIIKQYHTGPKPKGHGWAHVAYHVVIEASGQIYRGCNEDIVAGGCDRASHASPTSLEVCLCGNLNNHTASPSAYDALIKLLILWCKKYQINPHNIVGHKDVQPMKHNPTRPNTCPGNTLHSHLNSLRLRVKAAILAHG
jgi:N-acetylmuramoyl-L-alanine amidase